MVKRNTNFKQMFLADNTLIDVINSKLHLINNNTNNIGYIPYQNQSCVECDNSKKLEKLPFPEAIKDSNGNINTNFRVESSSNSESSSDDDDENGNNNYNSINEPSANNENIDSNYNSSNQRITQTQPNNENVYNSLNQRIIQPLQDYSPISSSDESDTENLSNSRSEFPPQITENRPNNIILTQPNNTFQENIADSTPVEMDISNNRDQIRQQNVDLTSAEEPFTAPLPEEHFMDINVSNTSQPRRSIYKMKRLKNKIGMKQEDTKRKSRKDLYPIKGSRTSQLMDITNNRYQIGQQNEDLTSAEKPFTAPLPEEDFMDINVSNTSQPRGSIDKMKRLKNKIRMKQEESKRKSRKDLNPIKGNRTSPLHNEKNLEEDEEMLSDVEEKHDTIDNERKKRNKQDISNLSRIRKQQRRKEKIKLLRLKQQRLKQLYLENKNNKMEHLQADDDITDSIDKIEDSIDNMSNANDDQPNDISNSPAIRLRKFAYGTLPQQENLNKLDETIEVNEDHSKRPRIQVRKFAYGTMPEQKNITRPEIRVAKFANQKHFKNEENISNNLQYLCELCGIQFPKYSSLKQHLEENHEKGEYKIEFPDEGKYLGLARKVKHGTDGNKFFYQNFNMNNGDATDQTSYWCSKCKKFFKSFRSMQSHNQKHENGEATAKRSITKDRPIRENKKMFYETY